MSVNDYVLESKYELSEPKFESVPKYIFKHLLIHSQKNLIVDSVSGISWNGQSIHDVSIQMANAFIDEYELKIGDIACFICPNSHLQAIGLLSVLAAGGVCVFLNEKSTYDEIKTVLEKINFKYLICGTENEKIASKLATNNSMIKKVFIIAEENYESTLNCVNIHTLLKYKTSKLNEIPVTIDPLDMALIEFTSGTNNGKRKAVIKTNLNLINSIHQLQHSDILFNEEEDILVSISFGKIFGISYFLNSLISGSKIVMIPENFDSDGFKFVENIEKFKVTKLLLFTSDVEFMINHEVNLVFNISSIKEILHIGLFEDYNGIRQRVESMFKCRFFRSAYGTIETGIVSCIYKSKSFERNCYSVGQLIPGTKLKIIDIKTGTSLPAYKIGEICVKSNQLTPGYLSGPEDEQKTSIFTKDGFFRTSDAGYYDNDGYLYIESKLSDMICIEEEVFSPKEIEILLLSHTDVIDATVIGIFLDDEYEDNSNIPVCNKSEVLNHNLSNTFKAFVVLRAGSDTNDLDLINYVNDRVEPIKQFDSGIFILDVLPRNCMGIINKSSLIKT